MPVRRTSLSSSRITLFALLVTFQHSGFACPVLQGCSHAKEHPSALLALPDRRPPRDPQSVFRVTRDSTVLGATPARFVRLGPYHSKEHPSAPLVHLVCPRPRVLQSALCVTLGSTAPEEALVKSVSLALLLPYARPRVQFVSQAPLHSRSGKQNVICVTLASLVKTQLPSAVRAVLDHRRMPSLPPPSAPCAHLGPFHQLSAAQSAQCANQARQAPRPTRHRVRPVGRDRRRKVSRGRPCALRVPQVPLRRMQAPRRVNHATRGVSLLCLEVRHVRPALQARTSPSLAQPHVLPVALLDVARAATPVRVGLRALDAPFAMWASSS